MIRLLWAVHSHQPVGNFDFIFERAYRQAYAPFLETLARHPGVSVSMHFSGILLDWLAAHKPEYIASLRERVGAGQVEILGGGFYEPILPVISDGHKVGQLRMLQERARDLFGVTPKGLWLAERVWEPTLVKPIADAGLEYVLLDGSHFKMVGKTEADMDGYYLSEDQGCQLKLFPIHDVIRDFIPFRSVDEVVHTLRGLDRPGATVQVVFGDDGEKFGDWPGTHDLVYSQGWLDRFFAAVEATGGAIRIEKAEAGLEPAKNLGLVYLPAASYQEMMVWAQDAHDINPFRQVRKSVEESAGSDRAGKFVRGTFWRNFFGKYPESNRMHKQGVRLSAQLARLGSELDPAERARALDHLWQAQCNCGYWHGVFGGLYLPHLRHGIYRNLIACQRILDRALLRSGGPAWETADWNFDGRPEYALHTRDAYLSFTRDGAIDQWWLKRTGVNLVDSLTRRYEAYHDAVGAQAEAGTKLENQLGEKEANLRAFLTYDRRERRSSADLFLAPGTGFGAYAAQGAEEALRFRAADVSLEAKDGRAAATFSGPLEDAAGAARGSATKRFLAGDGGLRVEWEFSAPADRGLDFRFASENLFCLMAGNAPDRYVKWGGEPGGRDILASRGEMPGCSLVKVADEWLKLECYLSAEGNATAWRDALETVSQSEGGYERVYQGTVLAPAWDVALAPGGRAGAALSLQIKEGA